eukprot:gene340-191_t
MSSVDASSTNDMSSTLGTSVTSNTASRLTADTIIKECIRQGYYRNPVCNEVLYLHHKGYDTVDPAAFDKYVDVKVLWLEGNGFSSLPCGGDFVQVRPPKMGHFLPSESEDDAEPCAQEPTPAAGDGKPDCEPQEDLIEKTVDTGNTEEKSRDVRHVDPMDANAFRPAPDGSRSPRYRCTLDLPDNNDVRADEKDVFSSLYRTVRQLYLHNNVFRVMPDLSRFQRLDSVNLSNNFFSEVRSCCPQWLEGLARHRAAEAEALATSKSAMKAKEAAEPDADAIRIVASDEARTMREAQLRRYAAQVERFSGFCRHVPLRADDCGKKWNRIPPSQRCPCASVRTLNLAGNHIESFDDLVGLLCYKALTVLDLSANQIKDGEMLLLILERLGNLSSLKLSGNPMVRSLRRYRKTDERRMVNAWAADGDAGEERERLAIKREKEEKEKKRLDDFRRLIARSARSGTSHHEAFIGSITTSEALQAIEREEQQSSATSSESDEEGPTAAAAPAPVITAAAMAPPRDDEELDDDPNHGPGTGASVRRHVGLMGAALRQVPLLPAWESIEFCTRYKLIAKFMEPCFPFLCVIAYLLGCCVASCSWMAVDMLNESQ